MCTASWVYPIDWEDHVLTAPFCELGGHSVSILVKCPALGTTSLPELAVMHPWGGVSSLHYPWVLQKLSVHHLSITLPGQLFVVQKHENKPEVKKEHRLVYLLRTCQCVAILVGAAGYLKMS